MRRSIAAVITVGLVASAMPTAAAGSQTEEPTQTTSGPMSQTTGGVTHLDTHLGPEIGAFPDLSGRWSIVTPELRDKPIANYQDPDAWDGGSEINLGEGWCQVTETRQNCNRPFAGWTQDTFTLSAGNTTYDYIDGEEVIVVAYTGTYRHHVTGRDGIDPPHKPYVGSFFGWGCAPTHVLTYNLSGELTYWIDRGTSYFRVLGPLTGNAPNWRHANHISIALLDPDGGAVEPFRGHAYDAADLQRPWFGIGPPFGAEYLSNSNNTHFPGGSEYCTVSGGVGTGGRYAGAATPAELTGEISGTVRTHDSAPPGELAGTVVKLGRHGEFQRTTRVDSLGHFTFDNVEISRQVGRHNFVRHYVVAVDGAATRPFAGGDVTLYGSAEVTDVTPVRTDLELVLGPVVEQDQKLQIINRIQEYSPTILGSVEQRMEDHLLAADAYDDEEMEQLRRALWAERVIEEAVTQARPVLDSMFSSIGSLANQLVDTAWSVDSEDRSTDKKVRADYDPNQEASQLRAAHLAQELDGKVNAGQILYWAANRERIRRASIMSDVISKAKSVLLPRVADATRDALIRGGMARTDAQVLVGTLSSLSNALLDGLVAQSWRGGVRGGVKELVTLLARSAASLAYDGRLTERANSPAFANVTVPSSVTFTGRVLEPWTTFTVDQALDPARPYNNAATYADDAWATATILNGLQSDNAGTLESLQTAHRALVDHVKTARAIVEGFRDVVVWFGVYGRAAATAATTVGKLLEVVEAAGNILVGSIAFVHLFSTVPDAVARGVCAAHGRTPLENGNPGQCTVTGSSRTASSAPPATMSARGADDAIGAPDRLVARLDAAAAALRSSLDAAATAFEAGELGTGYDLVLAADGSGPTLAEQHGLVDDLFVEAQSLLAVSSGDDDDQAALGAAQASLTAAHDDSTGRLDQFLTALLLEDLTGADDPRYEPALQAIAGALRAEVERLDDAAAAVRAIAATRTPDNGPFLAMTVVEATSNATGRLVTDGPADPLTWTLTVRNRSDVDVAGATVSLAVPDDWADHLTMAPTTITVPTLTPDDGQDGSGEDEYVAEVVLTHDGDAAGDNAPVTAVLTAPEAIGTPTATTVVRLSASAMDKDDDGLPDGWESAVGLDPATTNADGADADGDGLTDLEEFLLALDPTSADTDADGLTDLYEIEVSDTEPADADTDDDGALDGNDAAPLDATSTVTNTDEDRPESVVTPAVSSVTLTPDQPAALVTIGGGDTGIRWHAQVGGPSLVEVDDLGGHSTLLVQIATGAVSGGTYTETVRLLDVAGRVGDLAEITVIVDLGGGTGGSPAGTQRLSGASRDATAVAIAQTAYPSGGSASTAVLARRDSFPDGLAGAPLAAALDGPLLLTGTNSLPAETLEELRRVLPSGREVIVLGGTAVVAESVLDQLRDEGWIPRRVAGTSRFSTAVAIAREFPTVDGVVLVRGDDFADALSAAPAAIATGSAVLLTNGEQPSAQTLAYLDELPADIPTWAIGGQAARAHPDAAPLVGASREATAVAVAREFFGTAQLVGLARRDHFADALAAGPFLGARRGPLLLTDSTNLHPDVAGYLTDTSPSIIYAFGGAAALSDAVLEQAAGAAG